MFKKKKKATPIEMMPVSHLQGEELVPLLESAPENGLTDEQVSERMQNGLVNYELETGTKTLKQIILSNIFTYFNMIFTVLAIAVIAVGHLEHATFMFVVFANTFIGIVQEYKSKQKLDSLNLLTVPEGTVVRNGTEQKIPVHSTVRDDVIRLEAGDQIYADAVLLRGECLVNESLLTGEADEISKTAGDSLLSGSFLVSGSCYARLIAVGHESYMSRLTIQARAGQKRAQSEMMRSLTRLVVAIGILLIPLGAAMLYKEIMVLGNTIQEGVVSTVASLVGMIPEGLYLLTSLALLTGVIRLATRKTLVQDMGCIETLARVDTLCVDKTGTITEPKMTVEDLIVLDTGHYTEDQVRTIMADYVYAMQNDNETMSALKGYFSGKITRDFVSAVPFHSGRKFGGVTFRNQEAYLLGSPENILGANYEAYRRDIEVFSELGCRVLLLASYDRPIEETLVPGAVHAVSLILLTNKLRPEAPDTFRYFHNQGVHVKVISGDNPVTVSQVALEAGIEDALNYIDARALDTEEALADAAERYTVFGRVTPVQKKLLVAALRKNGHTVAMTGDGINDVLALKEADCSIAIASGSQAARHVSHIVLMDSNFASMPHVVAEGRRVINNIERSASLYLVKNIFSFMLALISLIFTFSYPFSPAQMTLIASITIGFPSFVLALEPNNSLVKGRFLPNVIYHAIPSAFSDLILTLGLIIFASAFSLTDLELSNMVTLCIAIVGLLMVYRTCKPFNPLRVLLCISTVAAFVLCITVIPSFFAVSLDLSYQAWLIFGVFALLAFEVSLSANLVIDGIRRSVNRVQNGILQMWNRFLGLFRQDIP